MPATTWNPKTRTFTALASSFAPVKRARLFDDPYIETLPRDPSAWDLGRVYSPAGLPLLAGHNSRDPSAKIGQVLSAQVTQRGLEITAQLGEGRLADELAPQVASGLAQISIGYSFDELVEAGRDRKTGKSILEPNSLELMEVSLVGLAADAGAHVRNFEPQTGATIMSRNANAAQTVDRTEADPAQPGNAQEDRNTAETRAVTAERRRITGIRTAVRDFGFPDDDADEYIDGGHSLQETRAALQSRLAERSRREAPRTSPHSMDDLPQSIQTRARGNPEQAIAHALALRMGAKLSEDEEAMARDMLASCGGSLLGMGRTWLDLRGERAQHPDAIASRMLETRSGGAPTDYWSRSSMGGLHTVSDFPNLLGSAGNRVLLDTYQAAASGLLPLAAETDLQDFRAVNMIKVGTAPKLDEVGEHGEVSQGTVGEAKEALALKTYSKIIGFTRQAIINDDLGALADRMRTIGLGSAQTVADTLAGLFTANSGNGASLDDGKALYHADHNNLVSGNPALSVDGLGAGRKLMRQQRGIDPGGKQAEQAPLINVSPKFLLVGGDIETLAEQVLAEIFAGTVEEANPFAKKLQLLVEPRLSGNAWRLFSDPAVLPTLKVAYLQGQRGPILQAKDGWNVLGTEFRAILDFGAAISDHRGTVMSTGAGS